jgi:hypothetical protein
MKLKDIKHRGRFVLPPVWNKTRDTAPAVIGEVGVLRFVYAHPEVSSKCYIVMDQSEKYIGELVFDDKLTAHRAVQLLRANIGQSIKDIGDIELAWGITQRVNGWGHLGGFTMDPTEEGQYLDLIVEYLKREWEKAEDQETRAEIELLITTIAELRKPVT